MYKKYAASFCSRGGGNKERASSVIFYTTQIESSKGSQATLWTFPVDCDQSCDRARIQAYKKRRAIVDTIHQTQSEARFTRSHEGPGQMNQTWRYFDRDWKVYGALNAEERQKRALPAGTAASIRRKKEAKRRMTPLSSTTRQQRFTHLSDTRPFFCVTGG
jgi:hypothetical protein